MQVIPKPPHGSLEWLNVRHRDDFGRVTFGASEAGALMGVSEYTTLADLCISKLTPPEAREPEPQMIKGIIFEEALLTYAGVLLGCDVETPQEMYRDGRFTATLDGLCSRDGGLPFAIVEAKVTAAYTVTTADDLPRSWVMQGHVQSALLDLPVFFIVFDKRQQLTLVEMPFDGDLMEAIWAQADIVGESLDQGMIPDCAYRELTAKQIEVLYPVKERRAITADDHLVNLVFDLETVRNQLKKLKDEESTIVDQIAQVMQDADEVTDANGHTMLTWRTQKGRKSFDAKAFQAAHPDLHDEFMREGAPYRVMRFGKGNR